MLADQSIFIAIALLILQGFTIKYLMDLEKINCLCAMNWKRDYLILYAIFTFVAIIVSAFFIILIFIISNKKISLHILNPLSIRDRQFYHTKP